MMNKLENIDELFRGEFENFAPPAPAEVWSRIEKDLAVERKKIRIPAFLRVAAGIILIAGISWLVWKSMHSTEQKQVLSETVTTEPEIKQEPQAKPQDLIPDQEKPVISQITNKNQVESVKTKETNLKTNTAPSNEFAANSTMQPAETTSMAADESLNRQSPIQPIQSRSIILASDHRAINPVIKHKTKEIDRNEEIIQQNILALGSQQDKESYSGIAWSVGGQAGPQYTYRDVQINTPTYPVENYNKYESGMLEYAGGLQFQVEPAKRFSIRSGVYYSKIGQTKSSIQIDNPDIGTTWHANFLDNIPYSDGSERLSSDVVNSTGTITFDKNLSPPVATSEESIDWTVGEVTAEQYFEYVEVPFLFRYMIIDKKLDVNLCTGIWANFLVGNKAIATDNANNMAKGKTKDINTFNYSGSVSIGLEYPVTHSININFEPFFKYYLSPINTNPETNVYPYTMGVLTGINYSF